MWCLAGDVFQAWVFEFAPVTARVRCCGGGRLRQRPRLRDVRTTVVVPSPRFLPEPIRSEREALPAFYCGRLLQPFHPRPHRDFIALDLELTGFLEQVYQLRTSVGARVELGVRRADVFASLRR